MSTTELTNIPGYHLSRVIFDVTWAVILALNYSNSEEKLDDFLMRNGTGVPVVNETFAELLSESLNKIRFNGSSVSNLLCIVMFIPEMCCTGSCGLEESTQR